MTENTNMKPLLEQEQILYGLLAETNALLPHLDEMGLPEAEYLYALLNQGAKFTSKNSRLLGDMELRVALCDYRDIVLDAVIDKKVIIAEAHSRARKIFAPCHHGWALWGN